MPSATVRVWDISTACVDAAWKLASPPAPLKHPRCLSTLRRELSPNPPNVAFVASPATHHPIGIAHFIHRIPGIYFFGVYRAIFQPWTFIATIGCSDTGSASCARIITRAIRHTTKANKLTHFGGWFRLVWLRITRYIATTCPPDTQTHSLQAFRHGGMNRCCNAATCIPRHARQLLLPKETKRFLAFFCAGRMPP